MKRKRALLTAAFLCLIGIGHSLTAFAGEEVCIEKDSKTWDDTGMIWKNEFLNETECLIGETVSAEEVELGEGSDHMYSSQETLFGDGENVSEEGIPIDESHFPDENFRNYLKEATGSQDCILPGKVDVLLLDGMGIKSLEGIQYFPDLTRLLCEDNQLQGLDVSKNEKLTELNCAGNHLISLNASGCGELTKLNCVYNQLPGLNVENCEKLTELYCDFNQLKNLGVSNCVSLEKLHCSFNQLTSLQVEKCRSLTEMSCGANELTDLNVENCENLTELACPFNQLTSLRVENCRSLTKLNCVSNGLTGLNVENCGNLTELACGDNHLTSLDVSKNVKLENLYCVGNQIEIAADRDNRFNLSALPEGFDVRKASGWSGGQVDGDALTVDADAKEVTYTYDVGKGDPVLFTLKVTMSEEETRPTPVPPETPGEPSATPTAAPAEPTGAPIPTAAPAEPTGTPIPTAAPAEPTGTPIPTAVPAEPTGTPIPTAAPAEPTGTPIPTAAPAEPTGTPIPTAVPAEPTGTPILTAAPAEPAAPPQAPGKLTPGQTVIVGSLKYQVKARNTLEVMGGNKKARSIAIPASVTKDGVPYKVTSIRNKALKNHKNLKKVVIGKEVRRIGKNAFSGCTKLSRVTIQTTKLKTIGKNAFKGIRETAVIKVPKKQYAKYKKYLKASKLNSSLKIKK